MTDINSALEAQREILLRLTALAQFDPQRYYPSENESLCRFCGIRPRRGNLCESCEARRERLAKYFPDVPPPTPTVHPPALAGRSAKQRMTPLIAAKPEWLPYKAE